MTAPLDAERLAAQIAQAAYPELQHFRENVRRAAVAVLRSALPATVEPEPCWTCGGSPNPSGRECICGGTNLHTEEVANLRLAAMGLAAPQVAPVRIFSGASFVEACAPVHESARPTEPVAEWANRLAADSVKAGESEYGEPPTERVMRHTQDCEYWTCKRTHEHLDCCTCVDPTKAPGRKCAFLDCAKPEHSAEPPTVARETETEDRRVGPPDRRGSPRKFKEHTRDCTETNNASEGTSGCICGAEQPPAVAVARETPCKPSGLTSEGVTGTPLTSEGGQHGRRDRRGRIGGETERCGAEANESRDEDVRPVRAAVDHAEVPVVPDPSAASTNLPLLQGRQLAPSAVARETEEPRPEEQPHDPPEPTWAPELECGFESTWCSYDAEGLIAHGQLCPLAPAAPDKSKEDAE